MNDQLPPAGWHPDPHGSPRYRYWDGRSWTDHYAPMQSAARAASSPPAPSPTVASAGTATRPAASHSSAEVRAGGFGPAIDWVKAHKVWSSVIGVFAFLILVGIIGSAAETSNDTATQVADSNGSDSEPAESGAEPEPTQDAPTEPAVEIPDDEAEFLSIVHDAASSAPADANELQIVQIKTKRGQEMCSHLGPSLAVQDWVGTVEDVSTELGGDNGVFAVRLSDTVSVQTWNNSMSDVGDNTLIDPASPLFNTISEFSPGDVVRFSGTFVNGDKCLGEQSLVDISGLRTPDFTFRFSAVQAD